MLNLDQVRLLENRVEKAVGKIQTLTAENTRLHSELSVLQTRVNELEGLVRSFRDDQGRIEEGILNALDRLSAFEDTVYHSQPQMDVPVSEIRKQDDPEDIAGADDSANADQSVPDFPPEAAVRASAETASPDSGTVIEADWQTPDTENRANPSSDGQMDIF
jgi:hypothetical protein